MPTRPSSLLEPRKTPVQRRSTATVVAIFEATIQVLLAHGHARLTTTKVAERAGVSVGTLYQYFPNKSALLAAVLERFLDAIVTEVEQACRAQRGRTVREIVTAMCRAFIEAKTRRLDVSLALYQPAAELGCDALVRAATQRSQRVLIEVLGSASDRRFADLTLPAMVLTTATVGPVQAAMEAGADPALMKALQAQLVELSVGYLERISTPWPINPICQPSTAAL